MLTLEFRNDGTGNEVVGSYDVTARANRHVLWRGRVEGHERGDWLALVDEMVDVVTRERMEADDG